jgi:hypothetical protein
VSTVYVDLSAKIEQWTKDSVIAIANDQIAVLLLKSRDKQLLRSLISSRYGNKHKGSVQFRLLALLVYVAIRPTLGENTEIVIDRDYSGEVAENRIRNHLLQLLRRHGRFRARAVRFGAVKGYRADILARDTYRGKRRPDGVIDLNEMINLIGK